MERAVIKEGKPAGRAGSTAKRDSGKAVVRRRGRRTRWDKTSQKKEAEVGSRYSAPAMVT